MNVNELVRLLSGLPEDLEVLATVDGVSAVPVTGAWMNLVNERGNIIEDDNKDPAGYRDAVVIEGERRNENSIS